MNFESPQSNENQENTEKRIEATEAFVNAGLLLKEIKKKGTFIDLNRSDEEKTIVDNDEYSINVFSLDVDKLREARNKLAESVDFLEKKYKNQAEGYLIEADMFLADHNADDKKKTKEESLKRFAMVYGKKGQTTDEIQEIYKKEGFEPMTLDQAIEAGITTGNASSEDEVYKALNDAL
jgi:hypothetical protein